MLVEKGEIVCKDKNAAEFMKNYFINIKKALNLKSSKNSNNNDIIELISQFNDHVRIKKQNTAKNTINTINTFPQNFHTRKSGEITVFFAVKESYSQIIIDAFTFSPVSLGELKREIMNLYVKKPSLSKSISPTILKQPAHIYLPFLTNSINHFLHEDTFPGELKQSEVVSLCKKLDLLKKKN